MSVALVALVLLMIWWMAVQGKGRTGTYAREYYDDGARGMVELGAGVPEQALRAALAERHDIVSVSVSVWDSPHGDAGLRIRVLPRQGAAPLRIAEDISALAVALDRALGAAARWSSTWPPAPAPACPAPTACSSPAPPASTRRRPAPARRP